MSFLTDAWNEGKGHLDERRVPPLLKLSSLASEVAGDFLSHLRHPKLALRLHLTSLSLGWHQSTGMWDKLSHDSREEVEIRAN